MTSCYTLPDSENQRKRKERQLFGPGKKTKKAVAYVVDSDTSCNGHTFNGPQMLKKLNGILGVVSL